MGDLENALIRFGVELLSAQLGQSIPPNLLAEWPAPSEQAQGRVRRAVDSIGTVPPPTAQPHPVFSIFCLVKNREGQSLSDYALPQRINDLRLASTGESPGNIWKAFGAEFAVLRPGAGALETFTNLMSKYGSTTAGQTALRHISVYEHFKAVAALAVLLPDPDAQQVALVSGDLPGIQEMLYTITAKGAGKGLRGRSFYLQLLSDALVRCILRELDLPSACVIFNAGGNFKLLARAADESRLENLRLDLTRRLYALHRGELRVALAWTLVDADDLAQPAFSDAVQRADDALAAEKRRPWIPLVRGGDYSIFEPSGFGSLAKCSVCHVELPSTGDEEKDKTLKCDQCDTFEKLAGRIAETTKTPDLSYLSVTSRAARLEGFPLPIPPDLNKPTWEQALGAFGYEYGFADQAREGANTVRYRLNGTDMLGRNPNPDCGYAFRPLASFTPFVTSQDEQALRDLFEKKKMDEEEPPRAGTIRTLGTMSEFDATGIERLGVLRMDVDWLGEAWQNRLRSTNMLVTSALSGALTLFFEGWLNRTCKEEAAAWKARLAKEKGFAEEEGFDLQRKEPYVIYSGGDDLFIVGPWDVLPPLALRIRRDWESFVRRGYVEDAATAKPSDPIALPLTISAGIFLESDKFPLYQAADHAKTALDDAKDRAIFAKLGSDPKAEWHVVKDAVCFLGKTVGWDDFAHAEKLVLDLAHLSKTGVEGKKLTHGFLSLLLSVARVYDKDKKEKKNAPGPGVQDGRWMWKLAYGLRRAADQHKANPELREGVMHVANDALDFDLTTVAGARQWRTIEFLELPVRWAEFLIRGKAAK